MAVTDVHVEIIGDEELIKFIQDLPPNLFIGAKKAISAATLRTQTAIRNNFNSGASSLSSNKLSSRTGNLSRSIRVETRGDNLNNLGGSTYTDSVYAKIQELGGKVVAKDKYLGVPGGPYLNIPLPPNLTAAGVMRKSAREVFNDGGFIFKSKAGKWIVASNDANSNVIPMFILVKSVTLRPRLGMLKAAEDQLNGLLSDLNDLKLE